MHLLSLQTEVDYVMGMIERMILEKVHEYER
jgi:hypothetical protein